MSRFLYSYIKEIVLLHIKVAYGTCQQLKLLPKWSASKLNLLCVYIYIYIDKLHECIKYIKKNEHVGKYIDKKNLISMHNLVLSSKKKKKGKYVPKNPIVIHDK